MFRQVLVPVEFSACGLLAARQACEVVRAIGGSVTLLHVLEYAQPEHQTPGKAAAEQAQSENAKWGEPHLQEARFLEAQAQLKRLSLAARRPPVCLIVPSLNGAAPVILEVAAQVGAELIILGLHRQNGARGLGRVVAQVLLGACVPVQVTPSLDDQLPDGGWRGVLNGRLVDLL
ncbi:universal stress protein [Deinococcus sp. UYEF24]